MQANTILNWIGGAVAVVILLVAFVVGWQTVRVYIAENTVKVQRLAGEAQFAQAEQNRKILIEQARAEKEAATFRAEAIGIVGQAAKEFPEYRHQEFLGAFGEALNDGSIDKIVFIPTEANIPVTEAGRTVGRVSHQ